MGRILLSHFGKELRRVCGISYASVDSFKRREALQSLARDALACVSVAQNLYVDRKEGRCAW